VAFADNLYPGDSPLPLLRDAAAGDVAALASRYRAALAPSRGILITSPGVGTEPQQVKTLVEKPGPTQARDLEEEHGTGSLLMLEGRARLTAPFVRFARSRQHAAPGSEPKLALALGKYARDHRVVAVPADGKVIDLGAPAVPARREHSTVPTNA
jgi:UTP-glucose-1-phosphate uridylyltransferase